MTHSIAGVYAPWVTDRQGFICHYVISGPVFSEVAPPPQAGDPFYGEARMREAIADRSLERPTPPRDGEVSRLGAPWRFAGGRRLNPPGGGGSEAVITDAAFVNLSAFYPRMCRVRFDAVTALVTERAVTVTAALWSYAAVDAWLNGAHIGGIEAPRYKPIRRAILTLDLKPGANLLYLACETLGVRDTRSVVGVQLLTGADRVHVALPEEGWTRAAASALAFLEGVVPKGDRLAFHSPAPTGARMACTGGSQPDYAKAVLPVRWTDIGGLTGVRLPEGEPWITLEVPAGFDTLTRRLERTDQVRPNRVTPTPGISENRERILRDIAGVESLNRGAFGFAISNILARKATGLSTSRDEALLWETLELIDQRVDCADFLVCGLIRYLKRYPVTPAFSDRAREVLLNWRYWMDMDGADGMCFWSENHSLMFYSCAMFSGEMYPDDRFSRAGKTGAALAAWGRSRVIEWLCDVERWGFEEFLSGVYMSVTFAALLNLIDFADADISRRAAALADRLLRSLALHTFKGGFIAPMGRTYRGAIYPFAQPVMALMNLADPSRPYDFGEGWLGFYADSRYQLPENLKTLMDDPVSTRYTTGNAEIALEKHADWCLTSVACPRDPYERWPNTGLVPGSHQAVKAANERFHGTTDFRPGTYGYQQHLWYAALDEAAILFSNHPGATSEDGDMRPGYWHGNGVMPALKQRGNLLGMIYRIPENHPIHFIHLYAPKCRFDEYLRLDGWLFVRRGRGYVGFWCVRTLEPVDGVNVYCELRAYGSDIAGLCVCGDLDEFMDLNAFSAHCRALCPAFDPESGRLTAGDFALDYVPGQDDTQYL